VSLLCPADSCSRTPSCASRLLIVRSCSGPMGSSDARRPKGRPTGSPITQEVLCDLDALIVVSLPRRSAVRRAGMNALRNVAFQIATT
jgi:hypothetical protein